MATPRAETLDSIVARAELQGFTATERAHDRRYRDLARNRKATREDWEELADEGAELYDRFTDLVERIR